MQRIVSLLPSATEIVCALGFEGALVGRSHECDYPPAVARLPAVTEPKFDPHGSSAEIDGRVKRILTDALAVYRVDADRLRELKPDVIVTQSQCDVCAVSMHEVELALAEWTGARPKIVSLAPWTLSDVMSDMRRVAEALGVPERGDALAAHVKSRMESIGARATAARPRLRVAWIEWIDPLMGAGNWMPELAEMAGGENLFGEPGRHSPRITFADLAAETPDVIMIVPCGFDLKRTRAELPALTAAPGWAGLKAVRERRVYLADGNQYFNRPGPRIAESLEILAEILHPELFRFGHQGAGWQNLEDAVRPAAA